jgi:Rod binding domain-containing protein
MHLIAATAAASAGTGTTTATVAPQPRLVKAAHEVEAQMMQELLKPMTENDGLDGDSDSASGSDGVLGEFASEALGRGLSERGGFGIAAGIVRELSASGNKTGSGVVTGKVNGNTVVKSLE